MFSTEIHYYHIACYYVSDHLSYILFPLFEQVKWWLLMTIKKTCLSALCRHLFLLRGFFSNLVMTRFKLETIFNTENANSVCCNKKSYNNYIVSMQYDQIKISIRNSSTRMSKNIVKPKNHCRQKTVYLHRLS